MSLRDYFRDAMDDAQERSAQRAELAARAHEIKAGKFHRRTKTQLRKAMRDERKADRLRGMR